MEGLRGKQNLRKEGMEIFETLRKRDKIKGKVNQCSPVKRKKEKG